MIAADRAALEAVGPDDALAPRLRRAVASAERSLAAVAADPLGSGTMSPTATVGGAARRAIAEAQSIRREICR